MLLNDFPLTWPFFYILLSFLCVFSLCATFSPIPSSIISLVTRWRLWVCILGGSRLQRQWIRRRSFRVNKWISREIPPSSIPPPPFPAQLHPPSTVYQPPRLEKISAHRIGLLRGLSSWRQNRKTLRKRVNNDFSFLLQHSPPPPSPSITSASSPVSTLCLWPTSCETQRSTKIITKQSTLNIAYSAWQEHREYIHENDTLPLPFCLPITFMTFFWWCNERNNQKIIANSFDLASFVDPICRDW